MSGKPDTSVLSSCWLSSSVPAYQLRFEPPCNCSCWHSSSTDPAAALPGRQIQHSAVCSVLCEVAERKVERIKMDQSVAPEKFWKLPELIERMVSFLNARSTLCLLQSRVMDKETLQKSIVIIYRLRQLWLYIY